jgi:uncharacterized repeat protein (TIGR03803 family)
VLLGVVSMFILAVPARAISILRSFSGGPLDGRYPNAALISDGSGNLYGTTLAGGTFGLGTVFTLRTDGTGFVVLHDFAGGHWGSASPNASLVLDASGNLYGTTEGADFDWGTVFTLRTDGSGFKVLHYFFGGDVGEGARPLASLALDGLGNLYGTTSEGGNPFSSGRIFALRTDGTGYRALHDFAIGGDGGHPYAALCLDGSGNLYGTANAGGARGLGTVFRMHSDGTGYTVLHNFGDTSGDGSSPVASLILDASGNLYGTTASGGSSNLGTVFMLTTDGTGYTVLHEFTGGTDDGARPGAALVLDATGDLFGTTNGGGDEGLGTAFKLKTDGTGYTVLHEFAGGASDGALPSASLTRDVAGTLFGTTFTGGSLGLGTVFALPAQPVVAHPVRHRLHRP